jgi:hypothetical protein
MYAHKHAPPSRLQTFPSASPSSPAPPQANAAVLAELEAVRGAPSPLVAVQQQLSEHSADTEKFIKLIDNLQV